jgi:3-dehydroquinate dehydratase-2
LVWNHSSSTLPEIEALLRADAALLGVELEWFQTNHEGEFIDAVQALPGRVQGAVINAGALTHTSLGLRDALLAVQVPFVEVHLSNLFAREAARRHSHIADLAVGFICGFGAEGYRMALRALAGRLP